MKLKKEKKNNFDIFHIFAQNIDRGYRRGGSNEYPQSMFWSKNKKKLVYPGIPQKAGLHCTGMFPDAAIMLNVYQTAHL